MQSAGSFLSFFLLIRAIYCLALQWEEWKLFATECGDSVGRRRYYLARLLVSSYN